MDLHKIKDLLSSIKTYLIARRKDLNTQENRAIHIRLLSQERDGCILYTWNDFSTLTKADHVVTHVGIYDNVTQSNKVLWIYNQKIKIVSCSVNQERTLLAFTLVTKTDASQELHAGKEKYSAFLAELQATGQRVFSLNLERPNFLKVQFLYPGKREPNTTREAHMIVFLHKESIGLYHIPLARVGDKGIIMNDQPRTEQIVKKFVWCQWDPHTQTLHYILNTRHSSNPEKIYPKYSCIQFYQDAKYDNMLDVPLNFPFPYIRSASRCRYVDSPLNTGIPDIDLNIQVLTHSNGTVCICYQHLIRSRKSQKSREEKDDEFDINYYICLLHHAKTLHGCVNGLHKTSARNKRIYYQWAGDYLVVMLPGVFLHLLNISIEYEPCHHILLHNKQSTIKPSLVLSTSSASYSSGFELSTLTEDDSTADESTPYVTTNQSSDENTHSPQSDDTIADILLASSHNFRSLIPCFGFTRESGANGAIYDQQTGYVWKLNLKAELLLQYFGTTSSTNKLAILHYIVTRVKDFVHVKKLFKNICEDITNTKVKTFLAEYLVAGTYMNMKRQLERDIFRLLPFTSIEPFKGQLEKNQSEERIATVTYSPVDSINITNKTARERDFRHTDDMWDSLRRYLRLKQAEPNPRFKYEMVITKFEKPNKYKELSDEEESNFLSEKHLQRQSSSSSSRSQNTTENVLGNLPEFLNHAARDTNTNTDTALIKMVEASLTEYLQQHLKKDWKVKAKNVAQEYITCQLHQSKQLCHVLWSVKGPISEPAIQVPPDLYDSGSVEEYDFFILLERFYLTLTELSFPSPFGFQTYFTSLGFRCLNFTLFMQYVERGILKLTGGFISQLLTDLSDEEEDVQIKYHIISRLPKKYAEECFKQWKHPLTSFYLAKKQAALILKLGKDIDVSKIERRVSSPVENATKAKEPYSATSSVASQDVMTFAPLTSLLQHLETTASVIESRRKRGENESPILDKLLLDEVSLFHTKQQNLYNLSLVNF